MKIKFTLFILFHWFIIVKAYSSDFLAACPGDVTLASQAEVDAFDCTELAGTLTISGEDITDLSPLGSLTKVGGLIIRGNKSLTSVSGLSIEIDLASPSPSIIIDNNPLITWLGGFDLKNTVIGSVEITNNANLTSMGNFSVLNTIRGHLHIKGNSALTSLWGFQNVKSLEASTTALLLIENNESLLDAELYSLEVIRGSGAFLAIINNKSLHTLDGFGSLTTIDGMRNGAGVLIANNLALENINGLSSFSHFLGSPSAYIRLDNNANLKNIDGLSSLRIPAEDLSMAPLTTILKNASLTRFCGIFNFFESLGSTLPNLGINIAENGIETTPQQILAEGSCTSCTSDITLSSQADVDAFGCPTVEGNLLISGNDITNLDALSSLKTVGGRVVLSENSSLVNLNGLSSLENIGQFLSIQDNAALPTISGFELLQSTAGVYVGGNLALHEINGFNTINSTSDLNISANPQLTAINGFSSLTEVKLKGDYSGSVSINSNDALTNVQGFSNLARVQNIGVADNNLLNSIEGMLSLTSIDGDLSIRNNSQLSAINGFASLDSIGKSFGIANNTNLTGINSFASLRSVGNLFIVDNKSLNNVDGLSGLRTITNLQGSGSPYSIGISGNSGLKNLDGLSSLTVETIGSIRITDNPALETMNGFSSVKTVRGFLEITNNESLISFNGFKNLTSGVNNSSFPAIILINNNASLPNLDGFSSLKSIQGNGANLRIIENKSLTNINGLSSLTTMQGGGSGLGIFIEKNAALKNINGLSSLVGFSYGIAGAITITENALLEDVDGLSKVNVSLGNFVLTVTKNPSLMRCSGLLPMMVSFGLDYVSSANFKVSENGSGCTLQDILAGAAPTVTSFSLIDKRTGVKLIGVIQDDITLDIAHPDFSNWILQANTVRQSAGSVEFNLDNKTNRVANGFPYQFEITSLSTGTHTVKADVYSKPNKQGLKGLGRTATIQIINSAVVVGFDVVDTSGKILLILKEGDKINIKDPAFKAFNIRANVSPDRVANVKFYLNKSLFRTETESPYALNGDTNGKYSPWDAKPGNYTLRAVPYVKQGGSEVAGKPLEIHFKVAAELATSVIGFDIVDTSGKVIMNLRDGDRINLNDPKLKSFTVIANTSGQVGSVRFWLDNQPVITENVTPYSLKGDQNGYFNPWTPVVGNHSLSAIPYRNTNNQGEAGRKFEIRFTVVKENAIAKNSGVQTQNNNLTVSVYPVPLKEELFLDLKGATNSDFSVTIRNNQGYVVHTGSYNTQQLQTYSIKTSGLPQGVYLLQLRGSHGFEKTIRLVKE